MILVFCGVMAVFLVILQRLERWTSRRISHRLGWRAVLLTGWLGVPIHELSHLACARLAGHRIVAWRLFSPDPASGTLGYVRHAYSKRSLWQLSTNTLIGLAPVIGGGAVLLLLLSGMTPAGYLAQMFDLSLALDFSGASAFPSQHGKHVLELLLGSTSGLLQAVWSAKTAWLPLQLYACICVASHLAPSRRDLALDFRSCCALIIVLAAAVVISAQFGWTLVWLLRVIGPVLLLTTLTAVFQLAYVFCVHLFFRSSQRKTMLVINAKAGV